MMESSSPGGIGQVPERRTFSRFPYQRKAMCQLQAGPRDDAWMVGNSRDISLAGLGFVLHRSFDPGTLLTIDLQRPKRDSWKTLQARVLHSTPQTDGNWRLGCTLLSPWSKEEFQDWADRNSTSHQ